MTQLFSPEMRLACNQPGVKLTGGVLSSTAANMGAAAGIALQPSAALLGDLTIVLVLNGGETMAISAKDWGGSTITAVTVISAATGNPVSATALASGTYYIQADNGASLYSSLIFTKSAAVQQGVAAVFGPYDFNANL